MQQACHAGTCRAQVAQAVPGCRTRRGYVEIVASLQSAGAYACENIPGYCAHRNFEEPSPLDWRFHECVLAEMLSLTSLNLDHQIASLNYEYE